jgi:glycosyltransferase involved in cell wall biosynthesis
MRILVANTHRGFVGGVEYHLSGLLPALARRGHALSLLYEVDAAPGKATIDGACGGMEHWRAEGDPAGLLQRVAAWRPDVVYLHGMESPTWEAALADAFPTVFLVHNYYGTCISSTKRRALPRVTPCERVLGPGCLLRYLPCRCGGRSPITMLRLYRLQQQRRALLRRYRAVVVISRHMREEYRRHGVDEAKLYWFPYTAFQKPDDRPPPPRPLTGRVLMLGRLTTLKGGCLLIRAVVRAGQLLGRPLTLVVAGEGPDRRAMEALAARLGAKAEFVGWVGAERRLELMRGADVLAVPSVWPEPFGLVGPEAGAVGLPAVAFAVGGIPDWLVPEETGELATAPLTAEGLADALVRALRDPDHRARLGEGAWRKSKELSPEAHLAHLEPLLERVARDPGRGRTC